MARALSLAKLMRSAHHLAETHAAKHGTPNEDAFWEEWDAFTKRNEHRLYDADFRIICAYAAAALHYTERKRYWAKQEPHGAGPGGVMFIPIEHEAIEMPRGMWANRNPGNIATDVIAGVAA